MPSELEQKIMSTHPQHAPEVQAKGPQCIYPSFNPRGMPEGVEFIFDKIPKPGAQPHQFSIADVTAHIAGTAGAMDALSP